MLQLKLKHGKCVQTLNTLKKKLNEANEKAQSIEKDMEVKKASLAKKKADITKTERDIENLENNNKKQTSFQQRTKDIVRPLKFVQQMNAAQKLTNDLKNKERKVEIASLKAKRARKILKARDE